MKNKFYISKSLLSTVVLSLLLAFNAKAQNKIEGLVRDANTKQPINAAQISISGQASAVSSEEGKFTINLRTGEEVLHVTAFDYGRVETPVQGRDFVVIDLYPEIFTNFFRDILLPTGERNNSSITVSVNSSDNITQIIDVTADGVIQTNLGADVRSISRSGMVGVGNSMLIRGFNSLNANAQPLFVVDGVIWDSQSNFESIHQGLFRNPLEYIDVNDIESITVLKDGVSIYGAKAANGVLFITTKRAKSPVTKIGLNIFYGINQKPTTTPMMNGDEYRIFASDLLGSIPVNSPQPNLAFVGNPNESRYNPYYNNTNWDNEVYQTGNTSNYLINIDGGDDIAMYYFSVGYAMDDGVVKSTDMQRLSARFNVDARLAKNLTTGINLAYSRIERNTVDDGIDFYSSPTWQAQIKSPFLTPYTYSRFGEQTNRFAPADIFGIGNPSGILDASQNKQKNYKFNIGVFPVLTVMPGLTLSNQFDYGVMKVNEAYFLPIDYSPERIIPNKGVSKNRLQSQVVSNSAVFNDTRLAYEKLFGEHSLKAMIGFRYEQNQYEMDYIEEHNSGSNANTRITGSYEFGNTAGIHNEVKSITNYYNVDYDFKKKYFLTASMALNSSSRFGKSVSWGVFPSINGAWLFSSEKFMSPVKFVNFGKIRAGYGITGNDAIPDYESYAYFSSVRLTNLVNGLVLSHYENEKIQWEETQKANLGIDLGLFKNRLSLSFDVYNSKTNNLLTQRNLPETLGNGLYWSNGGSMENNGFELAANIKAINLKDFQWDLGFSLGKYKNKITSLSNEGGHFFTNIYGGEIITQVGSPAGLFYGYKTDGIFRTEDEAAEANMKNKAGISGIPDYFKAGDVRFVEVVKDGIIDEKDKQIIGDPNPDFYGTINSTFAYKRFKLDALFTYSYGNDVYNYHRRMLESGSDFSNQSKAMVNRWIADGQNTNQPKSVYGDPLENARFSDRWIEEGSYIRLKNITLSYQIPVKNDFIRGINVWTSAQNLFTITNYLGRDPEFSIGNSVLFQGIDAGFLPLTRGYYLGVRIDF